MIQRNELLFLLVKTFDRECEHALTFPSLICQPDHALDITTHVYVHWCMGLSYILINICCLVEWSGAQGFKTRKYTVGPAWHDKISRLWIE